MKRGTFIDLFLEQAKRFPERQALIHNGQCISYAELRTRAQNLGMFLINEHALSPEQLVGIHGSRSIDSITGILAVMLAGGAYVPIPADWPQFRKDEVIEGAGLQLVLTAQRLKHDNQKKIHCVPINDSSYRQKTVKEKLPDIDTRQLAYVMFTSGSTGKPKGVMIEQRNVLAMLKAFEALAPCSESLIGTSLVSIGFDVSVWEIFSVLCFGGTLHLIDHPEMIADLARYFSDQHINSAYLPPLILGEFIRENEQNKYQSDLKRLLVGVEPIAQKTLQQYLQALPDLRIINGYGPTETTICATFYPFEKTTDPERRVPIGKALQGYQVHLVDEELNEVAQGEEGEILICGAGVGRGYYADPEMTARKFIADPFNQKNDRCFRSGDFARLLPDNNIEFIGRRDQQIKINGFRVELGEIEISLMRCSGIDKVVVVTRNDGLKIKRIVAYYTTSDGKPLSAPELRQFLCKQLPVYMQPYALVHLPALPLTANGKIARKKLPDPPDCERTELTQPQTELESALILIFSQVFNNDCFSTGQNFFDLGGNSLQAAKIVMLIKKELGYSLTLQDFYEHATIKRLADWLSSGKVDTGKKPDVQISPCSSSQNIPLSYSQERMWFLAQSEPDNPSLHSSFALRLTGKLDVNKLIKSLEVLVNRHAILRTVFEVEDGIPNQKTMADFRLPFRQVDLSGEDDPLKVLRIRITDLNLETFDIRAAPPYRLVLYHLNKEDYVLGVIIHHIIIDGWSSEIFKRDLAGIYEQNFSGNHKLKEQTSICYADYACWQQSEQFKKRIEPQLAYWQKKLKSHENITQLPNDKPRPISQTSHAATVWLKIDGELLEKLRDYSKEENTTQFAVLLSAFCAALNRHLHQDVIQLGSFYANRPLYELENVMGPFVNGVVLQVDLSGNPDFNQLVARTKTAVIEGQQNQEAPIEKVIEQMKANRDRSQRTMFGIVFNFVNIPKSASLSQTLDIDFFAFEAGTVTYDLNVEFNQSEDGLLFAFEFNTDIYHRQTVERFSNHFKNMLECALSNPHKKISEVDVLTYKESEQIKIWSGFSIPYPHDIPIHHLFEMQVQKTPQSLAVICDDESVTYDQLNQRANQLARLLIEKGLKPHNFVGICLPRSVSMLTALIAVAKTGGVYLPLDPAYPAEQLEYILQDAKPALILSDAASCVNLALKKDMLICLEESEEQIQKQGIDDLDIDVKPDDLVYCIYTSGSTGRPKGVLVEHRSLVNFTTGAIKDYVITPSDRMLQFASMNFDTSAEEIFPALCSGAALVLRTPDMLDSIPHFLQRCSEWGITILDLPTAFWHELVLYLEKTKTNLVERLRLIIIGGERVSPAHLSTWHKLGIKTIRLDNTYGLTECTCVVTRCELTPRERSYYAHREVTIGSAVDNVRLYVLDDSMQKTPLGVPGQLYVGGDCLAREYLNLPDLTTDRFIPDVFDKEGRGRLYKTGDVVQWRPDGTLEYLGRVDEQIKIRGFRIEPGEVEAVLLQVAGVKDAIVIKRVDPAGTEQLLAYLLVDKDEDVAESYLKKYLAEKLPKFMLPAFYQVLPEFPMSPNRKIDKAALPDPDWDRLLGARTLSIPETPGEEKMLAIWEEALGRQGIGVDDNFFDIGGHSLLAARMMTEVERQFSVPIPLVVLLEKPTIRDLTKAIEDSGWKPSWRSIVSMKASGIFAPLFLVHAIGGDILSYRRLVERSQDLNRPIYGIRAQGLGGVIEPIDTIETMAAFYIKEIREIQPHGPYYLGGYSFGGTVAYEMAQQLHSSGEEIALLAMFDTVVLQNLPPELRPNRMVMMLDNFSRLWFMFKKWMGLSLPKKAEYFTKMIDVLRNWISALMNKKEFLNPRVYEDLERWHRKPPAFQKIEMVNNAALHAYIAKPYAGKITLFKAREREWSEMVNPKPLWLKLAHEGLDVYTCNGNHSSLLLEPNVQSLVQELKKALVAVQAEEE